MDLENLVKRCKKGNSAAQKELFDRYSGLFMSICCRYVKDTDEAKDVLQEGFVKIFQKMSSYESTGSFEGWMKRTVVNTCLDHLRKTKKFEANVDLDNVSYLEPINEKVTSHLAHQDLLNLIQELPDGYRTVFNMYAIEGYAHREIADEMGISENTSKSQYRKAKLQLQEAIKKLEHSYLDREKTG
jgi:RNA polymerase sigma-70 factor (ECF subfamily)